ncbi:MAG TPA: sugar transferase [Planctomycetota bacterium]|nr:sugar transferase [Planctomycetota bacterium]
MAFWAERYRSLAHAVATRRGKFLFAFDLIIIAAVWALLFGYPQSLPQACACLLVPILWTAMSEQLYHPQRGAPISSLRQALNGAGCVSLVILPVWALADLPLLLEHTASAASLAVLPTHLLLLWSALLITHTGARLVICLMRRRGLDFKSALVCGSGDTAREIAQYLGAHPGLAFALAEAEPCEPSRLPQRVMQDPVRTIFLVKPQPALRSAARSLAALASVEVLELLDEPAALGAAPRWIGSLAVVPLNGSPFHHLIFKRLIDITLALTLLVVLAPLFLAISVLIAATSKGPIFFRQRRLALGGRSFTLYKFRTMVRSNEPEQAIHTDPNDPRITFIGRLLRPVFLDELPQLFNVVTGDMSLVGPRPERSWAADRLSREIADYGLRLAVKPGLTGLAQVDGLHGNCDMHKRVERDLAYIAHPGLGLDMKILFRTAVKTGKHLIGAA